MAPTSSSLAIVAGVGPGTGASIARKFSQTYPVVLLARTPASYAPLVAEIEAAGGRAWGIATDMSDQRSVEAAFATIRTLTREGEGKGEAASAGATTHSAIPIAAAVFNVGGGFVRKPFLEMSAQEFEMGFAAQGTGAFNFARAVLPALLAAAPTADAPVPKASPAAHPPTLIFTGATASLRGGPMLASFAAGKFALRALAQSLAREFGPKGVHVAHMIVDGVIDIPKTAQWQIPGVDSKIDPSAIADAYWYLHTQPRSMWTHEQDIRPWLEKF